MGILLCAVLLAQAASGEEPPEPDWKGSAFIRIVAPGGAVGGFGGPKYRDLYGTGLGLGAVVERGWTLQSGLRMGLFVELDAESYQGGDDVDALFGATVEPDASRAFRSLVGGSLRVDIGRPRGFFVDLALGLGAVFYSALDGTYSATGATVSLFDASANLALDSMVRVGRVVGRGEIFIGLGIEFRGGPRKGDDLAVIAPTASDTGSMLNLEVTIGAGLGF
jgi:hypothetical protein